MTIGLHIIAIGSLAWLVYVYGVMTGVVSAFPERERKEAVAGVLSAKGWHLVIAALIAGASSAALVLW